MLSQPTESRVAAYREIWNDSPLPVLVASNDSVVYASPAARNILEADLVGRKLQSIFSAGETSEHSNGNPVQNTGNLLRGEFTEWRTPSGDLIILLQPLSSRDGVRDAIRHSAEMESILASMADAVYVGDMHGIHICNRPALDMLGFASPEELKDSVKHLADRIQTRIPESGKPLPVEEQPFVCALRGEQSIREVLIHNIQTNRDVLVRCAAAPVYLDGEIIAAVAVNTDITETRRMERKLRETESLAAVGRLAWQVAHEINNPLQAATNLLTLAAHDSVSDQKRKEHLDEAQAQLRRTADVLVKLIGLHRNQL